MISRNQTKKIRKAAIGALSLMLLCASSPLLFAQKGRADVKFEGIKVLQNQGKSFKTRSASITFREDDLQISVSKGSDVSVLYKDIVSAEYSYSKHPRWKTGLELGAAGILFPPLWIVALPLGFTKHRKHWLTVRTKEDFVVIKIRKGNRKLLIPTFETRTGITVESVGEDK